MSTKRNRNLPQQLTLDHVSPATRLLEKRRHMFEVQEALDAQKEEFQRREATFKRREEMLKQKDLALQESLIKFNKFLQENDSKRNRAEKKRVDEAKQKQGKEAEIVKLLVEVERQKEKRAQMEAEVHKMSQYQAYLEGVLEVEEEYPEIVDLLSRYETLDAAHEDLVQRQHLAGRENEEERHNLQTFIRERTDEILGYNNKIAELQQQSEKTSESAIEKQDEADRQMAVVAERTLQLGQVMMACENIYQRCVLKSSVARKEPRDSDHQEETEVIVEKLSFIRDYVTDLQSIAHKWLAVKAAETATKGELAGAAATGGGGRQAGGDGGAGGAGGAASTLSLHKSSHAGMSGHPSEGRSGVRVSRAGGASVSRHSISTTSEER